MHAASPETTSDAPGTSVWLRAVGIILWPRDVFEQVVAQPRWLGMLVLVIIVVAGTSGFFLSTEVGRQAVIEQRVNILESFGISISDEQYETMARQARLAAYIQPAATLITFPVVTVVVAGVLFVVFYAFVGGGATFRQMFSVVTHAGVILVVQQLFVVPLNYVRESMSSPATLGAFFPMLEPSSFIARFLGTIDLFLVWCAMVLAIGVAVLYQRRTAPIAIAFLMVYGLVATIIASVSGILGGS